MKFYQQKLYRTPHITIEDFISCSDIFALL